MEKTTFKNGDILLPGFLNDWQDFGLSLASTISTETDRAKLAEATLSNALSASIMSLSSALDAKAPQDSLSALQITVSSIGEAVNAEITDRKIAISDVSSRVTMLEAATGDFVSTTNNHSPFSNGIERALLSSALTFPSGGKWEISVLLTFQVTWIGSGSGSADHETWGLFLFRDSTSNQVGLAINGMRVCVTSDHPISYETKAASIVLDLTDQQASSGIGLFASFPIAGDSNHTIGLQNGQVAYRKISL